MRAMRAILPLDVLDQIASAASSNSVLLRRLDCAGTPFSVWSSCAFTGTTRMTGGRNQSVESVGQGACSPSSSASVIMVVHADGTEAHPMSLPPGKLPVFAGEET